MPGIFGAVARIPDHSPSPVMELMRESLLHEPWYSGVTEYLGQQTIGALSTNPSFSKDNHLAQRPEAMLLLEGTAITIDAEHVPDDAADLAQRLLAVYLESGDDFAQRIGGHFNLLIADHRTGTLQLINDRNGFAHLYYYLDDEIFLFAPELKAFLAWKGLDRTLNEASFAAILSHECPWGSETLFSAVKMLPPASRLVFDGTDVKIHRYWRPEPQPEEGRSTDDWLDEAEFFYKRSLEKRIPATWDQEVILPLSGGLDSRLLFWNARQFGKQMDVFTHGQPDCTDVVLASEVAEVMGMSAQHHQMDMDPDWMGENAKQAVWLNDGQLNLRNATLVGISKKLKPRPVPFLNGIIGAYMSLGVGGLVKDDELGHIAGENELRKRVLSYTQMKTGITALQNLMPEDRAAKFSDLACEQAWRSFDDVRHVELFGDQKVLHYNSNLGRRMQGTVDVYRFYFHDLLPFVDEDLLALWLRIPLELRRGNKLYKELYRRRMKSLAAVPWSYTGLDLFATKEENSTEIAKRMKSLKLQDMVRKFSLGKINLRNCNAYNHRELWLRRNRKFRSLMQETLGNVAASQCDWFEQDKIDNLFKRFDRGRDYLFPCLMQAATVVLWHELFLNTKHPSAGLRPDS